MSDQEWFYLGEFDRLGINYDGYFRGDEVSASWDNYEQQFLFNFPCSGLYEFSLEAKDLDNTALVHDGQMVDKIVFILNVYPTVRNTYTLNIDAQESDDALSSGPIGGDVTGAVTLRTMLNASTMNQDMEIVYPYYKDENGISHLMGEADKAILFIPGLYGAKIEYMLTSGSENYIVPQASQAGYSEYSHQNGINLNDILSQTQYLHLKISKNGAVTPISDAGSAERISISTNEVEVPTSINDIVVGQPINEPLFFNLNGVGVASERLCPGIYIKRIGNHTEKILIIR